MANKDMKDAQHHQSSRKYKSKTQEIITFTPTIKAKLKQTDATWCWIQRNWTLTHCWWACTMVWLCWNSLISQAVKHRAITWHSNSTQIVIQDYRKHVHANVYIWNTHSSTIIIADKWIAINLMKEKICYLHKIECLAIKRITYRCYDVNKSWK